MKSLKVLLTLALLTLCVWSANAQSTTNIAFKITVETVTGGVTNGVNTNFRYDAGNAKDALKINGLAFAFLQQRAQGNTNDFGAFLKTDSGDRAVSYSAIKLAADNTALVSKLTALLLTNPDLLSASDLTSLQTIAAKAP